jgi:hypothetical protein
VFRKENYNYAKYYVEASISFTKDSNGKIDGATLHQGGGTLLPGK